MPIAHGAGAEEGHLNIIVVSGAMARARTLTLDWRHWTLGGVGLLVLFLSFTLLFNYVTLRYAASINHPLLQAILLDDQRQQARRAQEVVQGHLNAMAVKLGELQAQLLQLDGLGERLAQMAGLKPRDLPPLEPGKAPGRGGAWYSEWLMVEWPEQSKYTAVLTLLWQDNLKDDDDYAFIPALRRSLRLSSSARCSERCRAKSKSDPISSGYSRRCSLPARSTRNSCRRWLP